MKTSTKAVLGVYGAVIGLWLAGSAYFLANGRDEELDEGLIPAVEPLPREENAYYLFPKLHELHQTNYNFSVANDFVNGWTDSPAVLAEVSELVDAHSNLFACARQIIACRGYQVPEGEDVMMAVGPLVSHPTARLYLMKATCEAVRGDRKAAHATIDEMIAFGRFVRRTGTVVGYLVGVGYVGMATANGGRSPIAASEDCAWRRHLMEVVREQEDSSSALVDATAGEVCSLRRRCDSLLTNSAAKADLLLKDGLSGLGWLMRNNRRDGVLKFAFDRSTRVDWRRVDRSCVIAMLNCCFGYSGYAVKPKASLNELGRRNREFVEKFKAASYDHGYAERKSVERGRLNPFRENWLGEGLSWEVNSAYRQHYKTVFGWRSGRLRLACENYRAEKGRYPAELSELVPGFIDAIPRDPYDGEPIRYNAEHGYFWTPGPDGTFEGKVDFDKDGYPRWKNRNYKFVQLLDTAKSNRPPAHYQPHQYPRAKKTKSGGIGK